MERGVCLSAALRPAEGVRGVCKGFCQDQRAGCEGVLSRGCRSTAHVSACMNAQRLIVCLSWLVLANLTTRASLLKDTEAGPTLTVGVWVENAVCVHLRLAEAQPHRRHLSPPRSLQTLPVIGTGSVLEWIYLRVRTLWIIVVPPEAGRCLGVWRVVALGPMRVFESGGCWLTLSSASDRQSAAYMEKRRCSPFPLCWAA
ncbi:hypothetical protein QQF64_013041, partial [Cirrhinus molitorella]